jgi:transposase
LIVARQIDADAVRAAAKRSKDGPQARLLAIATIYDGASRGEAARIGGVTLQIVRNWVLKFNALGPEGLIDRKPPGQAPRWNDTHRAGLAAILERGPIPAVRGVVRWFQVLELREVGKLLAGNAHRRAPLSQGGNELVGLLLARIDVCRSRLSPKYASSRSRRVGRHRSCRKIGAC